MLDCRQGRLDIVDLPPHKVDVTVTLREHRPCRQPWQDVRLAVTDAKELPAPTMPTREGNALVRQGSSGCDQPEEPRMVTRFRPRAPSPRAWKGGVFGPVKAGRKSGRNSTHAPKPASTPVRVPATTRPAPSKAKDADDGAPVEAQGAEQADLPNLAPEKDARIEQVADRRYGQGDQEPDAEHAGLAGPLGSGQCVGDFLRGHVRSGDGKPQYGSIRRSEQRV